MWAILTLEVHDVELLDTMRLMMSSSWRQSSAGKSKNREFCPQGLATTVGALATLEVHDIALLETVRRGAMGTIREFRPLC